MVASNYPVLVAMKTMKNGNLRDGDLYPIFPLFYPNARKCRPSPQQLNNLRRTMDQLNKVYRTVSDIYGLEVFDFVDYVIEKLDRNNNVHYKSKMCDWHKNHQVPDNTLKSYVMADGKECKLLDTFRTRNQTPHGELDYLKHVFNECTTTN
ncbi:unnamed protein product [Rotaria magnacalcarata]|uniref:Uncharacterized protein n=1 Tax=Rotaria magnacalcarata TaxID=392030 RepID=A0A816LT39_9BILA|nr:unnamed protein product [Rotaria magnacalcarata]CAF4394876.1 unnamed protein product [Rotaria magnacalcarata]